MQFRTAGTQYRHFDGGVFTEYTPAACITGNPVFSPAQITYVLVAQELYGSGLQPHLCVHENCESSGQPCHLLTGLFCIFSLPVHHNTKHHLDSTTFSKTTLFTERLFQNLYSRQAALTNRSRTPFSRVAETRATPLSQLMAAVIFLVHSFAGVFWPWHKHVSAELKVSWIYIPEHSASRRHMQRAKEKREQAAETAKFLKENPSRYPSGCRPCLELHHEDRAGRNVATCRRS